MTSKSRFFTMLLLALFFTIIASQPVSAENVAITDLDLKQGIADLEDESYEEAEVSLLKARENDPKASIPAYYLGLTYKQMLIYDKAAENFEDAVNLRPGVKVAILDLAEMYLHLGKAGEALSWAKRAEAQNIKPAHSAFLTGLILAKLKRHPEAIAKFEEAKDKDSSLTQAAEYQRGVSLIKLGKLAAADRVFKEVIIIDPNSDLALFAGRYVDMLKKRSKASRPLKLSLALGYEIDDNVFLKPSDQSAAGKISGEDDERVTVSFRAEYSPKRRGPLGVKAQYSLFFSDHDELDTHNVESHTFSLVPSHLGKTFLSDLLLSYNYTKVEHDKYLQTYTIAPGVSFSPTPGQLLKVGLRLQEKDYFDAPLDFDEERDATEFGLNLSWIYLFSKNKGVFNVKYEYNIEDAEGSNWEYHGNKFLAALSVPILKKLTLNGAGIVFLQDYDNTHSAFLIKRKDTTWTASTDLAYELIDKVELHLRYTYIVGDSNVAIYDYNKYIAGTSIEIRY